MRANQIETFDAFFSDRMKSVYTAIPGYIIDFDPETMLSQVQIGVVKIMTDGTEVEAPPVILCPTQFPGGQDWIVEIEVNPGDECLIHFSQRTIDGWRETGGVSTQPTVRFHNVQDAFVSPGYRSAKTRLSGFSNDGIKLRHKDDDVSVHIKGDKSIQVESPSEINMNAPIIKLNGVEIDSGANVKTSATIEADTDVIAAGISGKGHKHGGVQTGGGKTGEPE